MSIKLSKFRFWIDLSTKRFQNSLLYHHNQISRFYCTTKTPRVLIRHARAEDLKAILDINKNLYAGLDYLPSGFSNYLKRDDIHMFVADVQNKIVGFSGTVILEDENFVVHFGGRVRDEVQNTGISKALQRENNMYVSSYLGKPFYQVQSRLGDHVDEKWMAAHNLHKMAQWNMLWYKFNVRSFDDQLLRYTESSVVNFKKDVTIKILEQPQTIELLKSHGDIFFFGWPYLPFNPKPCIMSKIINMCDDIQFTMDINQECVGLSLCKSDLYGNDLCAIHVSYMGTSDSDVILDHLMSFFKRTQRQHKTSYKFGVHVTFPLATDVTTMQDRLFPLFGSRCQESSFKSTKATFFRRMKLYEPNNADQLSTY